MKKPWNERTELVTTPPWWFFDRAALENASNQQATLLMDTKFCFAVKFPFHSSSIQLEELDIPDYYNNLHKLLKKV